MSVVRIFGVGVAFTAALTVATACGSSGKSSPSSSTSTASSTSAASSSATASTTSSAPPPGTAPLGDYTYLLLQASDVGPDATAAVPAMQNPGGVPGAALTFTSSDHTRSIDDLVIVFVDPTTAAQQTQDRGKDLGKYVTGTPQPFDVGTNGQITVGPSPDNSKAVTYVTFAEGKVDVDLEFDSGPNDPAPLDVVLDIARKQDGLVKSRLPS